MASEAGEAVGSGESGVSEFNWVGDVGVGVGVEVVVGGDELDDDVLDVTAVFPVVVLVNTVFDVVPVTPVVPVVVVDVLVVGLGVM